MIIKFFKKLLALLERPKSTQSKKEIYFNTIDKYSRDLKVLKEQRKESQA